MDNIMEDNWKFYENFFPKVLTGIRHRQIKLKL